MEGYQDPDFTRTHSPWPRKLVVYNRLGNSWDICTDEKVLRVMDYLAVSYRRSEFDARKLEDFVQFLCKYSNLNLLAYWLDTACIGQSPEEIQQDMFRIADVFRRAKKTLIVISGEDEGPYSPGWMKWGERIWTLPEALLSQQLYYVVGTRQIVRNVPLWKIANLAYEDMLTPEGQRLIDGYSTGGKDPLSVQERITFGKIALSKRTSGLIDGVQARNRVLEKKNYYLGEKVYALMGLLPSRIEPRAGEYEEEAFARLLMKNGLGSYQLDVRKDVLIKLVKNKFAARTYQSKGEIITLDAEAFTRLIELDEKQLKAEIDMTPRWNIFYQRKPSAICDALPQKLVGYRNQRWTRFVPSNDSKLEPYVVISYYHEDFTDSKSLIAAVNQVCLKYKKSAYWIDRKCVTTEADEIKEALYRYPDIVKGADMILLFISDIPNPSGWRHWGRRLWSIAEIVHGQKFVYQLGTKHINLRKIPRRAIIERAYKNPSNALSLLNAYTTAKEPISIQRRLDLAENVLWSFPKYESWIKELLREKSISGIEFPADRVYVLMAFTQNQIMPMVGESEEAAYGNLMKTNRLDRGAPTIVIEYSRDYYDRDMMHPTGIPQNIVHESVPITHILQDQRDYDRDMHRIDPTVIPPAIVYENIPDSQFLQDQRVPEVYVPTQMASSSRDHKAPQDGPISFHPGYSSPSVPMVSIPRNRETHFKKSIPFFSTPSTKYP